MLIALWIINGLLAAAFLFGGAMKALSPKEKLAEKMGWVDDFSGPVVRLIGTAEVLGAIGLIVPLLTGILPILTPIAAAALAVLMIGAVAVHVRRRESVMPSPVLALLAAASSVLGFLVVLG